MSSSVDYCPACGQAAVASQAVHPVRRFWASIVQIAIVEVALLSVLAGVFVAYLNWSSEVSFAEFLAASRSQPAASLPLTEVYLPCNRGT